MDKWDLFADFIEEVKAGAFATIDEGMPRVRAVVFVLLDEKNIIYTTSDCNSQKISQIRKNNNISFFIWKDHDFFRGDGKAEIAEDLELKQRILDKYPHWKKHYPLGPEDSKYCLIKIKISNLQMHLQNIKNK